MVPQADDSPGHRDGTWPAEVIFGGLAVAGRAQPKLIAPRGTGDESQDSELRVSCASVYCHGATLSGGTATSPEWSSTTPNGFVHCGACHGFPPALKSNREAHPTSTACGGCHNLTVSPTNRTGIASPENHINGRVDLNGGAGGDGGPSGADGGNGDDVDHLGEDCNACHGDASAQHPAPGDPATAPPVDTHGSSATTSI